MLGREENMMIYNVMLKALNSKVQENLKNSMAMDMHRKFFIYKYTHGKYYTCTFMILFFKDNPIIADLGL